MASRSTFVLCRAFRNVAMRGGPAVCISAGLLMHQRALRMDAAMPVASQQYHASPRSRISPKTVQQLSSGSIAGFATGLVVALFSRILVFLGSVLALSCYAAARYGIDVPKVLGIRRLLDKSSVWAKTGRNPYFAASFALTSFLAGFVRL